MKSTQTKRKEPSKARPTASRNAEPVRRVKKEVRPAPVETPAAQPVNGGPSMPDLAAFGISQTDAQAHVAHCEECGRAYRHVAKNPKDAMALQSFGRRIAACLPQKHDQAQA